MNGAPWVPFREPPRATIVRNLTIALVTGFVFAQFTGGLARWPVATLLMCWPTFGGHFVELAFLNGLRPRLPRARAIQVIVRLAWWFGAGVGLLYAMRLTAEALSLTRAPLWFPLWMGGVAFIGVEFVAQLAVQLRGLPSFYDGRA